MIEKNIVTKIRVYDYNELAAEDKNLIDLAKQATSRSYSPYSQFSVGAALLLANGEIITGSNQENVAFPSTLCAERTASFYASSRYPGVRFVKLAIAAWHDGNFLPNPISPCGGCRQVLSEYEKNGGQPIQVMLYGTEGIYFFNSIRDLLPLCFEEDLKA